MFVDPFPFSNKLWYREVSFLMLYYSAGHPAMHIVSLYVLLNSGVLMFLALLFDHKWGGGGVHGLEGVAGIGPCKYVQFTEVSCNMVAGVDLRGK